MQFLNKEKTQVKKYMKIDCYICEIKTYIYSLTRDQKTLRDIPAKARIKKCGASFAPYSRVNDKK